MGKLFENMCLRLFSKMLSNDEIEYYVLYLAEGMCSALSDGQKSSKRSSQNARSNDSLKSLKIDCEERGCKIRDDK